METIIPAIDRAVLVSELSKERFLRNSNYGKSELYVVNHENAPNVLREIGRLREITFREAGGGTGKSYDIDKYDTADIPYTQLIVWDPEDKEVTGGYRYICGENIAHDYKNLLATTQLFNFSDEFIRNYLPHTIELGRSFVQPRYQFQNNRKKGFYALDNLWDGLGALIVRNPKMKFFFGKITMYKHFNIEARNMILTFLHLYFPNKNKLITTKNPIFTPTATDLKPFEGNNYQKDYAMLSQKVRALGENIPPLFNAYMNLSPSMQSFGTVENQHFGGVEETGIMINIHDIYENKKERHIKSL
ncbi:MAG: GNAT family N-acetyltransferase [Bacteroidota bacterium]|nr:GNAT family N-acetyltransferase [Bacteroidota bacterium]